MLLTNLIIGLGIFLYGMNQLERGVEALSSDWIKYRLAYSTRHPLQSVLTGTAVTALVQSSSMVGLLVLAFASAGAIPLYNAIGVMLGANLGTTFTGWIVTTLGFKLNLAAVALPAVGLGGLIQVFADSRPKLRANGIVILGLGLLLFGLGIMKDTVDNLPSNWELEQLREFNALTFLLLGTVLTAVIQSSSATMMIALTALNSGIIDLQGAAALVIGADIGTTSTMALGSIKGAVIKRQLALAHFLFNLSVDLLAFIFLLPLLPTLISWINLKDPLYSLVVFHSLFNALGLLIYVPFLQQFSSWISKRFLSRQTGSLLSDVPVSVPEAAIQASQQHVRKMLISSIAVNLQALEVNIRQLSISENSRTTLNQVVTEDESFEQQYDHLKESEGELLRYVVRFQQQPLNDQQANQLLLLLNCARDTVYSTKTLKAARPDLAELHHTPVTILQDYSKKYRNSLKTIYQDLLELACSEHSEDYMKEELENLREVNERQHQQFHDLISQDSQQGAIQPEQLSTLLNVNRMLWLSTQTLLKAMTYWQGLESPITLNPLPSGLTKPK
ncbi:Na/Pi symporter [Porticoccaceae bacterium LTM1]|nr:Na/Pi symporter [Porticoccaceae bacterium LTM1]